MSLLERLGFKPTLPRFAAQVHRAMARSTAGEWQFSPERCALVHSGGGEIALRNMFVAYCNAPRGDRGMLVKRYAALADAQSTEIPALWEAAARNIYPVVRSEFAETTLEIRARAEGVRHDALAFPFAGDMRVRLVYDFGSFVSYVRAEFLETWHQSREGLLERAIANLGSLPEAHWEGLGDGVFRVQADEYSESMLLLDSVTRTLPFAADAVYMPCARSVLLAADGRSEDALRAMLTEAVRCLEHEPWPMGGQLFARRGGGWEVFPAPPGVADLARSLEIRHLADTYADQKTALEAVHEAQGEDVYVAEFAMITRGSAWESYCVWSQGVHALLPRTDWVAVLPEGDDADHVSVAWGDLAEVCGELLQATPEQPPRYRVDTFPGEPELELLRARAIA